MADSIGILPPELSTDQIADLRLAAAQMTGAKRRAFQAEMTLKYCGGSARRAKTLFGWSAEAVSVGLAEHRTGVICYSAHAANSGRPRWEDKHPEAAQTLLELAEAHAQQDPTFETTLAYTRLTAAAALTALSERGFDQDQLPSASTMAEVLIALEVIDSNLEGRPHSMKSLSSKLGIPYTSVSRIVYSLTSEAQPGGVLRLVPDTKDRRRKHIELDFEAFKRSAPQVRAVEKAMIDYYGSSVYKLKRDKTN